MSRLIAAFLLGLLVSTQRACAGPLGPVFGLGPAADRVIGIVVISFIALCGFTLTRKFGIDLGRWSHRKPSESEAQRILAERYARGEIGRDEYLSKIADVQQRSV
jgi:uncharacterized membrane protein